MPHFCTMSLRARKQLTLVQAWVQLFNQDAGARRAEDALQVALTRPHSAVRDAPVASAAPLTPTKPVVSCHESLFKRHRRHALATPGRLTAPLYFQLDTIISCRKFPIIYHLACRRQIPMDDRLAGDSPMRCANAPVGTGGQDCDTFLFRPTGKK